MNERIRELAEQSGFKVNWQHTDVQEIKMARIEKFAELILKQCLSYVDDSFGDVDYVKFMIKRDFGVSE